MQYIGHKRENGAIQPLRSHLEQVADLASSFASSFNGAQHAYRTGLLHDVGKYAQDVQKRMADPEHTAKVNHTSAGAQEAFRLRDLSAMFAIAGHHGGLQDRNTLMTGKLKHCPQDYSSFQQ
ncbi:MAG: CRISPR-associated endonuclease Cas3'' [Clostridia bacterium]|nr:CRISPR-associated endonuclease Cas3'' [Clostridia bacterium]